MWSIGPPAGRSGIAPRRPGSILHDLRRHLPKGNVVLKQKAGRRASVEFFPRLELDGRGEGGDKEETSNEST